MTEWPREDRPAEKLNERGAAALTDSELLALVLGNACVRGRTAVDVARELLARVGGLDELARAPRRAAGRVPGVGVARYARVQAALELGRRLGARPLRRGEPYRSGRQVYLTFRERLVHHRREVFLVVMLDAKHRPFKELVVSEGSLTASIVHPREVYEPLIRESAAATLFVHNHPSGDPTPSPEDLEITQRLREVGNLVGIRVLDHVIVAAAGFTSLAEAGWPAR